MYFRRNDNEIFGANYPRVVKQFDFMLLLILSPTGMSSIAGSRAGSASYMCIDLHPFLARDKYLQSNLFCFQVRCVRQVSFFGKDKKEEDREKMEEIFVRKPKPQEKLTRQQMNLIAAQS